MLTAIGQHAAGVTREQLTVLTGYRRSSRDTYLQRLTARGLAVGEGGQFRITEAGLTALGQEFEALLTGYALRPEGERKLLQVLVDHYQAAVEREALGERTGYQQGPDTESPERYLGLHKLDWTGELQEQLFSVRYRMNVSSRREALDRLDARIRQLRHVVRPERGVDGDSR